MNSWLGGGLSSLKGQLSHLITEGTEEFSDPSVEIVVAKKTILELENQINFHIEEISNLKDVNNDLTMKLQSEELLLQNVSKSYQDKLRQKEEIIEQLTNKLSNSVESSSNGHGGMKINKRLSMSDDGLSNDDFEQSPFVIKNKNQKNSSMEIDNLKAEIIELNHEIVKWKSLLDKLQLSDGDNSMTTLEFNINKLLEEQQQQLELEHSSYIIELQKEHCKQINFLNYKLRMFEQSMEDDDLKNEEYQYPDSSNRADDVDNERHKHFRQVYVQTEMDWDKCFSSDTDLYYQCSEIITKEQLYMVIKAISDKLISKQATLEMIIHKIIDCEYNDYIGVSMNYGQISNEDNMVDNHMTMKMSTQVKNALMDSMSQVSDISEVSIKSRLLDEHVKHLSDQINKYEKQFVEMDDGSVIKEDIALDVYKISDQIDHLKSKLSRRKHAVSEKINVPECLNEEPYSTLADSWENSSVNSLVVEEHGTELQEESNHHLNKEIKEMYDILYPDSIEISVVDMLKSVVKAMKDLVEVSKRYNNVEEQLGMVYNDVNTCNDLEQPLEIIAMINVIKDNVKSMKETCSVHEYIMNENKSLQELVSQLTCQTSILEKENSELILKNTELDEQSIDMSITLARYEGLEKICDKYQKYMSSVSINTTIKTNLSMDSEDILEHVETFNQEKDECIQQLESKIVSLQNLCEEKDDFISDLKQREINIIYEYDSLIEVLNGELHSLRTSMEKWQETELTYKGQIEVLQYQTVEKDSMIKSLNEELTMLSVIDIDNDIVSPVKVQCNEVYSQTHIDENVAILCELKYQLEFLIVENQRLEKVVEAQASSLGQYEIKVNNLETELAKLSRLSNIDYESLNAEDMTKETLHHLSQMIRDKEWEIDALKSKNESLCSIIKNYNPDNSDGAPNIEYIDKILNEKETLSKELSWYQENREQLISSLNLKHKESLNYHGELQRLISYINGEQIKWNEAVSENERLKEEIKKTLITSNDTRNVTEKCVKIQLVDVGVSFSNEESLSQDLESNKLDEDNCCDKCLISKQRCLRLEDENHENNVEIRNLRKQIEQSSFELEQAGLQIVELTNSFNHVQQQIEYCQNELTNQYKSLTPNKQEDSTKDIWSTEYDETVCHSNNDMMIEVEKDEKLLHHQLCEKQIECDNYITQIEQLKAREMKLLKEKQIFQDHLIRIEESYTQDATLSEDREQGLRKQLRNSEDNLQLANNEISKLQKVIANIRHDLQKELNATKLERDEAQCRVKEADIQLADYVRSLTNLQSVLDNIQQDQAMELKYEKERLHQELNRVINDRDRLVQQCNKLQNDLDAQRQLVDAAQRLTDQMENKEDQLAQIQALLAKKEEYIDGLKMEIRKLNSVTESKVDKVLMRNLVIGYFHTPQQRRQEALKVIGSLLQFTDTDYNQIGIDTANKSRWFSWLRSSVGDKGGIDSDSDNIGKSFSELFITFLEKESTPMPQVKLPTNRIAAEARQHSSLSQSQEYPYTQSTSVTSIIDHHKFFASSPVITKRNGSPSDDRVQNPEQLQVQKDSPLPLLYIPNIKEVSSDVNHKENRTTISNHRRSESSRNALLSLLDQ